MACTPAGQAIFVTRRSTEVPHNTEMDVHRYEDDLAAVTLGYQIRALTVFGKIGIFGRLYRNVYRGFRP